MELSDTAFLWLGLTIGFGILEAVTLGIVSIWFMIGAGVAFFGALLLDSFMVELMIFTIVSLFLICIARRWAITFFKVGHEKTNIDRIIGKQAVVTQAVHPLAYGEVKINGTYWRCQVESQTSFLEGDIVTVERIEGVTLIVK